MSKAVRWQVPFAAHDGTRYRVDIYDEGYTGNPVVLTAGETPFTTDEDDSDDFFAPVRTQTGTLQVCTDIEGSNTPLKLEDILPANNIARPVRLLKYANGSYSVIEWQGFLSCEAYSQDYIGIPQNLDLPLIGVLEAMDSIEVNPTTLSGMMYVFEIVYNTFHEIEQQSGMSLFDYVFYPKTDWRIFTKYIDTTAFFKQNEYNNENSTTYIVSGLSCKEVLEKIATYMGWIVREHKTWLYFQRVGEDLGMYRQSALDFVAAFHSPGYYISRPLVTKELASDEEVVWMGTGHQRTVAAGAKSVEVVAKLEKYKLNLGLNEFPFGDISELKHRQIRYNGFGFKYLYFQVNYNENAYNNDAYRYFSSELLGVVAYERTSTYIGETTHEAFVNRLTLLDNIPIYTNPLIAGAILSRFAIQDNETNPENLDSGLYCPLLPLENGRDTPIYKIWTQTAHAFSSGYITIKADMLFDAFVRGDGGFLTEVLADKIGTVGCQNEQITMMLQIGSWFWNGTSWSTTRSGFTVNLIDSGIDIEIPIDHFIQGQIYLEIWAGVSLLHDSILYAVIFKSLEVGYKVAEDYSVSDRTENHYFRLLGMNFRDEIDINTELASMQNNQPSPSLIMNTTTDPMKVLDYSTSAEDPSIVESRRPEADLLNRLATYYGAARQRLELEVAHISTPLPMLRLNGINDGKVYLPLAESRDWRTGVCKLTCFECPT